MAHKDPFIQRLLDQAEALDNNDPSFDEKLTAITRIIAEYQGKLVRTVQSLEDNNLVDPSDVFACEGCQ